MISGQCSCWIPPPCWPPGWLPHLGMFSVNWFLIIYIWNDSWEVWYSTFQGSYFHWLFDELICYAKRMYLPENPHPASNGDAGMIYSACTWLRIPLWLALWCWVDLLRMYLPENPPPAPIVMLRQYTASTGNACRIFIHILSCKEHCFTASLYLLPKQATVTPFLIIDTFFEILYLSKSCNNYFVMDAHYSSRIKELVQLCGLEINMIFSLDLIANSSCHLVALYLTKNITKTKQYYPVC